ncbi:MAG TPA: hypothetical protein VI278_13260 [Nitrososphaeraceae archaeon]
MQQLIPLAKLSGDSTEHLSEYYGSTVGSLLNSAEIIIAIVAIYAGLLGLLKASITDSILENLLLVFGLSLIATGAFEKIKSNRLTNKTLRFNLQCYFWL